MYRQIEKWENIFSYFLNYVNECKKIRREYINMKKISYIIILSLGLLPIASCQKKEVMPEFHVQISHPDNKYQVTPIKDYILTLEGTPAGLPYGSSSGRWADSGARWTEQLGTPIGADIVYYSDYEDVFYHLKADFPVDYMKEMTQRAYFIYEPKTFQTEIPEYINLKEKRSYFSQVNLTGTVCNEFDNLIFGFAPKGMVVVWLGYGPTRIELARYQAELVKDEKLIKEYEDRLVAMSYLSRAKLYEIQKKIYGEETAKATPERWDNYRKKYKLKVVISSENKGFRVFRISTEYFNGEKRISLCPYMTSPKAEEQAIPEMMRFIFETAKGASYNCKVFFDWDKLHTILEKNPTGEHTLEVKLNATSTDLEVFLDGEPIKTEGQYIRENEGNFYIFRDSYK